MRCPVRVLSFLLSCAVVATDTVSAQPVSAPVIQNVTVNADTNIITITGSGLGPDVVVTVDGQAVVLLPGAIATRVEIQAPAAVLTTPGTYRLTVVDPAREIGDAFVVASQLATSIGSAAFSATPIAASGAAQVPIGPTAVSPAATTVRTSARGPSPLTVIEDPGYPYRTAIGFQALFANTTGSSNTASGYRALHSNTQGDFNTANGYGVLFSNTFGYSNTGIGVQALSSNTTGAFNTASGSIALTSNTTGEGNTASGAGALFSNTTGNLNTASGLSALVSNTTGFSNTANGSRVLYSNTTGYENTASGYQALTSNATGYWNTASGAGALLANTEGYQNTATGFNALGSNTTGIYNTASGFAALYLNTVGGANAAYGIGALYNNTQGSENAALGHDAGYNATTGSHNIFLGANVKGTAADTNTLRIGLPYSLGTGQNRTFIAGIYGTTLSNPATVVYIDANGQLGTMQPPLPPPSGGSGGSGANGGPTLAQAVQAKLDAQHARIATLEAALVEMRERLAAMEGNSARRR